ncbi:MAG: hypothetical protein ABIE75_00740 [Candidatus Omnitrophota bacterium]
MANEDKVYDGFLKSFRVVLTNASVYFKGHPLLVKSVDNLIRAIREVLIAVDPLRMGITPDSLVFNNKHLKGEKLYQEIAHFFHRRKVKAISFKAGVSNEELITFFGQTKLSPKDILLKGGLNTLFSKDRLEHIMIEELDYSQLLKGEGEEYVDIWTYLLKRSFNQGDTKRIDELTDDFQKVLERIRIEDIVDNKDIMESISELFNYLKDKNKNKFLQCSKALAKSILKSGSKFNKEQIDGLKTFLQGLNAEDISNALLEQLQSDTVLDPVSLKLFSKLVDREKHQEVAAFFAKKFEEDKALRNNIKAIAGIKELISLPDFSSQGRNTYHDNLAAILENISLGEGLCFNREQLIENYRFVLLDLFILELSAKRLGLVVSRILPELEQALSEDDLKYIESFIKAFDEKKKQTIEFKSLFPEVNKNIAAFVEKVIFSSDDSLDLEALIDIVDASSLDTKFYLDKIFKEGRVNPCILKLFFKLFSHTLPLFYQKLDQKIFDFRFVERIMESLNMVEPVLSLDILKHIFSLSNNFIKLKLLKKMEEFNLVDEEFLFSLLNKGDFSQSKQVLLVLAKSPALLSKAAKMLLAISNPFGLRSKIIEKNLNLIAEAFFPQARGYLFDLSKYRFFWNRKIRRKAEEILERDGV